MRLSLGSGITCELRSVADIHDACVWWHTCNGVADSEDFVPLKPAWRTGWDVTSESPLTLTQPIVCSACGLRGFITWGQWEAAPLTPPTDDPPAAA